MNILFGMHLDGVNWSNQSASLGEVRTGPLGLLSILETRLGLSKPPIHSVHRIDDYMKRLERLDQDSMWFHKSFSVDPWSTTQQLLEWRDELIEAGWSAKPSAIQSTRLSALDQLENVDILLSSGRSDRIREVIESLKQNPTMLLASIYLVEPLNLLPPVWQEVIELLGKQGTQINQWIQPDPSKKTGNLSTIQGALRGSSNLPNLSKTNDSLILLKAQNEWQAAEQLALWLSSNRDDNDQVAIICGMDTGVLDQALRWHGLPSLGRSEPSRWREIQQILPLIIANAWKPVDVRLLVELLSLTITPFPGWVCRNLLQAVSKEPGVGGEAWNKAMTTITEKRKADLVAKGDSKAEENSLSFAENITALLVEDRFDPVTGIPEEKLRDRCQRVAQWLGARVEVDPMLGEVISQIRELQTFSSGKGCIPRITLDRVLDTIIGSGSVTNDSRQEASPWHVFDHPGQLVDPFEEIIWWGFNDPATLMPTYWSQQERSILESSGVQLEESKSYRQRETFAWQQGLMCAQKRFMAIHIVQVAGEEAYHHPYWDSILFAATQTGTGLSEEFIQECLVKDCKDFVHRQAWEFAGRNNTLAKAPLATTTPLKSSHTVPASIITTPQRLSYSQLNTLIGCPLKWALQYHGGLRLPESQIIPTGNQMIGTFCHRIVEKLYENTNQLDVVDAGLKAAVLYDQLLPSMASELLLEGNAIERMRYRSSIIEAIRQLVTTINQLELSVEKTEAPLEGLIGDIPVVGYADLLLRDQAGHPFILDLKWSSTSKYRKEEVKDGGALQLATYAWLLKSMEPSEQVPTGYFMLAQGHLISDDPLLTVEPIDSAHSLEEIWNMGINSFNDTISQFDSGVIQARGVEEALSGTNEALTQEQASISFAKRCLDEVMLYQKPPCKFCDFSRLCGLSGGVL